MAHTELSLKQRGFGQTMRPDVWWAQPLLVFVGLSTFIVYATWAAPPSCAVSDPRQTYRGEKSFPLILQNVHRYFLYLAILFVGLLSYDVWKALWLADPATGEEHFGLGLGTIVLAVNVVLLAGYTFGCHSLRHLIGGFMDQASRAPLRQQAYFCASCLNRRHMLWAWSSLCSVMFADLYVRLCSTGVWHDVRIM